MAIRQRQSARLKNLSEQAPWEDEVHREVYAMRDAYVAEHNYDLKSIYQDLKSRERESQLHRVESAPGDQTLES